MRSSEVRDIFVRFFKERGHTVVVSSSLVPGDDPTLLFTNAGMNQFKGIFLGEVERPFPRAVTVQKCMRVSGKHNDLENVGPSLYHHTFFEMLGNFSFGDYFKANAIELAWELLTDGYGLPSEQLCASVFEEDEEAFALWQSTVGLAPERIARLGKHENFWAMGDTGPCGPCSEIHYDYGVEEGCGRPECNPACGCGRFVELWNLVFMQFNSSPDGTREALPAPNIDTGAGLERLAALLQGKRSNYDSDLFQPIIEEIAGGVGTAYGSSESGDVALRAIADHVRALTFLIADGVMPSNEGRGYVLRRILRRAMRFGMKLGYEEPFLNVVSGVVVQLMGTAYLELAKQGQVVSDVIRSEEERFIKTLASGVQVFNQLAHQVREDGTTQLPGDEVFKLYDTFGLPIELTREFAQAEGMVVDEEGFKEAMEGQRARARAAWKGSERSRLRALVREVTTETDAAATQFVGYDEGSVQDARILAILGQKLSIERLVAGEFGGIVVDRTPFYPESGGQVGDLGELWGVDCCADVTDTVRPLTGFIVHQVQVKRGELRIGDRVGLTIDGDRRDAAMRNHTATHLLHAALRDRLGEHVRQAGSLVAPDRLRFDFTHFAGLDGEDLEALEEAVNRSIRTNQAVDISEMSYDDAMSRGALAFFDEKYGDCVRVVAISGISMELCGGTHVDQTGQIGAFLIRGEESVAAGTRRIEAVTGEEAIRTLQRYRSLVHCSARALKTTDDLIPEQVERLLDRARDAEEEAGRLRLQVASQRAASGMQDAVDVDGVKVLVRKVDGLDVGGLRSLTDELKTKLGSGVIVLGTERSGKAALVVGVTSDVAEELKLSANDVISVLAPLVGGGGGGHRELAQAGGPDGAGLARALEQAAEIVEERIRRLNEIGFVWNPQADGKLVD